MNPTPPDPVIFDIYECSSRQNNYILSLAGIVKAQVLNKVWETICELPEAQGQTYQAFQRNGRTQTLPTSPNTARSLI